MPTPPALPAGRSGRTTTGDYTAVLARLEKLATAVDTLIASGSDTAMPSPDPNEDPALTAARNRASISDQRARARGKWITVLVAALSLVSAVATNLYSYVQGYVADAAARVIEAESLKDMHKLVEQHEARLSEIVERERTASAEVESELRRVAELQALQSAYLTEVMTAIAAKKRIPPKSAQLVAAEVAAVARTTRR